jgi:hypothetical protein
MLTHDRQRKLKQRARRAAAKSILNLLEEGWPYKKLDGEDTPEDKEELECMQLAMQALAREVERSR